MRTIAPSICRWSKHGWGQAVETKTLGVPGAPATYVGMCHIFCDSVDAFQAGFGPHAKEIMGDIPNYTDQSPVIQISEVVVG